MAVVMGSGSITMAIPRDITSLPIVASFGGHAILLIRSIVRTVRVILDEIAAIC